MDPTWIKMCSDIITQNVVPFGMNMLNKKIEHRLEKELMDKESQIDIKKAHVFDKMSSSNLIVENEPEKSSHEIGVADFENLDSFHNAKWDQYFGTLEDLDDFATRSKVKSVMGEILEDIKVYPCTDCKENSTVHLEKMKDNGKAFLDVGSKSEALERLCEFKNEVNEKRELS